MFLRSTYFLTLLVEFGEVGLATLGERVSRRRHALPQCLLGRTVGPRSTLPLLDELEHSLPTGLPVRRFHSNSLGLGDDAFLDLPCLIASLLLGLLLLDLALFRAAHELVQPSAQCVQVTDRVGLVDRGTQFVDACHRGGGGQIGTVQPFLQQFHLGHQGLVLLPEEGQGFFRSPCLPRSDDPFAFARAHVDRAVVVYAAPRVRGHRVLLLS